MFQKLLHLMNFLLVVVSVIVCCSDGVKSQCPRVYEYKSDDYGNYGIVRLPGAIGENYLKILFALGGALGDPDDKASIDIQDKEHEINRKLQTGGNIKYKIKFPRRLPDDPEILSIVLNKKEYCKNYSKDRLYSTVILAQYNVTLKGPEESELMLEPSPDQRSSFLVESATITENKFDNIDALIHQVFPNDTTNVEVILIPPLEESATITENKSEEAALIDQIFPHPTMKVQDNWLKSFKFNSVCGRRKAQAIQTVIHGRPVVPHEFPWLTVLFDNKGKFFCGGTLVSDRHIITAAHCIAGKQAVIIELGKHNLENREEDGVALRFSQSIVNHPEYKSNTAHADISIITLSEKVSFSDKIKPICLWPFDENPVGLFGTVAGWGIDRSGGKTSTPMAADIDILSDTECRDSDPLFDTITSETTFCAGGKNKGPCLGDSGSGFAVERDNRWYLKGITSTSVKSGASGCNVNKPGVYCDVEKYLGWLKTFLLSE